MQEQWETLIRVTRDGEKLFEGEIHPGSAVELDDNLVIEWLWIRKREAAPKPSATKDNT